MTAKTEEIAAQSAPGVPAKADIQDELAQIASEAARKYFRLSDAVAGSVTTEEAIAASRLPPKEAPMYMHMIKDFMSAQIKTNARDRAEKQPVNIFVGVKLPTRRELDDSEVIEVTESQNREREDDQ